MKELKRKNREKREIEGLKIITNCICSSYDFRMPEIWVPVASKEVPVASRRVGVASKGVGVASRRVLMRYKLAWGQAWHESARTGSATGLSLAIAGST